MATWLRWFIYAIACCAMALSLTASQRVDQAYWQLHYSDRVDSATYSASYAGVGAASHQLGIAYWNQGQRSEALAYYRLAAEQGYPDSAFALAQHIPSQRQRWLNQAAAMGHPDAIIATVTAQIEQDPERAAQRLTALAASPPHRHQLAQLLFNAPWLEDVPRWQDVAPDTAYWAEKTAMADVLKSAGLPLHPSEPCRAMVHVASHGATARTQLYQWLGDLQQHPFAALGLCAYELEADIECKLTSQGRIDCALNDATQPSGATIVVVDLDSLQGANPRNEVLASARNQTITIAAQAEFSVLTHELGHVFGLADEYPMRPQLAQLFCSGAYAFEPLNLVITAQNGVVSARELADIHAKLPWQMHLEQPIAQGEMTSDGSLQFRLGSQDTSKVGLFAVETCAETPYQAWRPVAHTTFMQQHEVGEVPMLYLQLMQARLEHTATQQ